ncbi:unnamed protein product [Lathyrus sativus]|nr:unnamed protein product [Lathyrus sativus]
MSHLLISYLIFFCLFFSITICHALNNGFSVDLIHRDSIKSPLYNPAETKLQRIFNAVHRSINRATHFNRKNYSSKAKFESTLTYEDGEYLMIYSIGTPPFKVYGMIDPGSNLIWLQCKPCNYCYNQTYPIFNPSKSSSYENISCSSKTCKSAEDTSCSHDKNVCEYTYDYGRGEKTEGNIIEKTLTLDSTSGSSVSFPKIVIGCGHTNHISSIGRSSGVIGFGSGRTSLIKQLGSSIGGKFSYCLIDENNSQSNLSSKLNFGNAAIVSGESVVSTPMVKIIGNYKDYYFLNLEAFSVGNKRITYEGFKHKGINASTHNIIIDSGTTVTIFPQHFYNRLESAVRKVVKLKRFQDDTGSYNLCYNTTSKQPNFPVITAHFSGADVKLYSNNTFAPFPFYEGVKCFAFRGSRYGAGIFGSLQQMNFLIGYDLNKQIVSFKPTDCTKL